MNNQNGLGFCVQQRLADAGLMPAPTPVPVVAETPAAVEAPAEAPAVETAETATETPAVNTAPITVAAQDEQPAAAVSPEAAVNDNETVTKTAAVDIDAVIEATFTLLRAEPDGSVVIAGTGRPGSEVQLFANGDLLGSTPVENSGDWVFVPEAPLATGGLEITLGEAGIEGTAEQAFIVVINEDKTSQPLVVASAPGKISEVLQGLVTATAATTSTAVETVAAVEAVVAAAPPAAVEAAREQVNALVEEPAPVAAAAPAAPEAPVAVAAAPEPVVTPTETPAETPAAPAQPAEPTVVAEVDPATIDAIEIEGEKSFFAGAGANRNTIRLYVDDKFVADATVEDERWLIEAGPVLKSGNQRVRIDQLNRGTSDVISRAEVDFILEVPGTTETAQAPVTEPETPVVAEVSTTPVTPASAAAPTPAPAPAVEQPKVPTMVAVSLGDPNAQRFASGKAIIRRGDNLWTIARRVYGEGLKYTTIYQANTGQIRDPNRIYPGQVFSLPGTTN